MEAEAYGQLVSAFLRARDKKLTKCTLISMETAGMSMEELDVKMSNLVRTSGYVGCMANGNLQVLLANSGPADAEFVLKRLQKAGIVCHSEEEEA